MREILFRGRSTTTRKWIKSMTVSNGTIKRKHSNTYMESANNKWSQVERKTIGQYTGLNDKNGKEIFEGDIYHQGDIRIIYQVIYRGCQFVGNQIGNKSLAGLDHFLKEIEVIGNIHDNPEMLENK